MFFYFLSLLLRVFGHCEEAFLLFGTKFACIYVVDLS